MAGVFFDISIHAPAKGATARQRQAHRGRKDFNPRSREGSDVCIDLISCVKTLFQSTLPRRERRCSARLGKIHRNFNPRSREGSDLPEPFKLIHHLRISIHAPAKGATQTISVATATQVISIHAPAKGATKDSGISATSSKFQSTLPRRERLNEGFALNNLQSDFNPRSREGSDKFAFPTNEDDIISIHAPAKGATIPPMTFTKLIMPFQSTLPRRERHQDPHSQ